ncbi:TorF family putative porin [Croceicoccus sp. Ery15]|uniref:TorF family putative porin n=1 Tax=Croceicoccus sp. Ery15 TaxID=1703338 RepID=UPI001E45E6E3|nr:TorF family putative porin [Croceicoccus sp. Ery15]
MKTLLRGAIAASLLASSALVAAPAFAQDESEISVSANVAMVTDYRFRGVSYSGGDFAIQGGVDIAHSSGFYIGTWASSLEPTSTGYGNTEVDLYGGYSGAINDTVSFDVGLLYYMYPSASGDTDYYEPYASVTAALGPAEVTAGLAYAWEQDSTANQDNLYLYTDIGFGVPGTPVTISGHLGYTDGVWSPETYSDFGTDDQTAFDWSIGASMAVFGPLEAGISYVGVEAPSNDDIRFGPVMNDTVVATLSASF